MDRKEKEAFISNFLDSMRVAMLEEVDRYPSDWDGRHLRVYIAEAFAWEAGSPTVAATRRRVRKDRISLGLKY